MSINQENTASSVWHPGIPEHYRNAIVAGDVLDLILALPNGCIDLIATDPPYSSGGVFRSDRMLDPRLKYQIDGQAGDYGSFGGDNRDQRAYAHWCALWLGQCLRVSRPGAVICCFTDWRQLPVTTDALQAGGWVWRGIVPWDKTEAARPEKGRFRNQCEYIVWASHGPMSEPTAASPCLPGFFRKYQKPADKVHIAGKPVGVMRQLLEIVPRGSLVLDPFSGGGSTAKACAEEGYRFIGFDIEPRWAGISQARADEGGRSLWAAMQDAPDTQGAMSL